MSSKQQPSRKAQNVPSVPTQSAVQSLICSNFHFDGDQEVLFQNLKRKYPGITDVVQLGLEDNEKSLDAIRIDVKSDHFAKQFLDTKKIGILNKEYAIQSLTPLSFISKAPSSLNPTQILQDLAHNYLGIGKVSRFYDSDGNSVDEIRIDFKSDASPTKIIKDNYIFIDGKQRPIQPCYTLVYIPTPIHNGDHASEETQKSLTKKPQNSSTRQPRKYLTEERVKELFREQQMQLEAMINEFDNKWNARLSSLKTSSTNTNVDQLLPIIKDLTMVCQQFNQQNAQLQRQLGSVVHRVQDVQMKLNNVEKEQAWPQLPIQNGH